MSAPLSLRVCCLVAMAPALTDPVATQTKLKIKVLDPSSSLPLGKPVEVVHKDSIAIHKGTPNCKVTLNSVLNLKQIENSILKTVGLNSKIKQIKIIQKGANRNKNPGPQLGVVQNNEHSGDQKMNQPLESVNGMPKENGLKTASELKKSIELNTLTNLNGDHNPVNHTLQNGDPEQTYTVSSVPDMVTSVNSGTEVARDDVCDGADIDTEFVDIENEETDPIKSEKELSEEVSEKQHVLERRADRLLKRLRRLQGRQLETHIRNQTGSYVSFLHRNLQSVAHRSMGISGPNSELKAELLKSEDVKSLSTAALVNLVRRIQSTQNQAALNKRIATQKKAKEEKPSQSVLVIDGQICKEANRVSGQLQTNLNHILDTLDSDATESSSGGESCDEDDEYERERKIPPPPLHRRAEWKWASDRAAVACRWTWLQAQVSDLEYRIRQQSDIHKQIRHNKGSVVLGEPPSLEELGARLRQARANGKLLSPIETKIADFDAKNVSGSPCNIAAVMTNVNRQATKLTQSLGNCLTPIQSNLLTDNKLKDGQGNLNGVVNSTHPSSTTEENVSVLPGPSGDTSSVEQSPPSVLLDATCQAARCRPVRSYRKRKLLRTSGLHQVSRKAARLSTVKCHCSPPFSSCPMCGGRYNNSQTVDADTMPVNERVSLLDPSYHPVLSFNEEIPLTIHFEALLKSGDWQNKPPPKATKLLSTDRKRQKLLVPSVRGKVRKQTKYAKGAATALLASAKLRNKYERRTPTKGRPSLKSTRKVSDLRKRRINDSLSIALKQDSMDDGHLSGPSDYDDEDEYANCGRDTLLSSSGASGNFKELKDATMRKRRLESAYDIDNIVIPYSIASATRVVKLEYKEIVTPKWRDITENFEETDNTAEDPNKEVTDETENTSDEFFAAMHDICEIQERKRFQSFIKYPSRRSRGSRNDSGPLTPDTASTDVGLVNEGNDSAQKIDDDSRRRSHTLSSSGGSHTNLAASLREEVFRRRSSSASLSRNSVSVGTDDMSMDYDDGELVEPWPVRSFPLSEEEYEEMKASVSQPEVETCTYVTRNKISSNSIDGLEEETSVSEGTTYDAVETQVSVPESPNSSAGSHTSEDPNDPEWTVANSDKLGDKNLVRLGRR